MSNDWWSKKLSGSPTTPNPTTQSTPPVTAPIRFPSVTQPPQHRIQHSSGKQERLIADLPPDAQLTMGEALKHWKGGEATRKQGDLVCPECGSPNVFVRTSKGTSNTIHGNAPAPRCFECGWNGLYDQASQVSWGM